MDRNVAAGYDPNVEWGSESILAGQNIADLGDDADEEEEELELRGGSREERPSSSATVDDVDLPEFGFEESDEVSTFPGFSDCVRFGPDDHVMCLRSPSSLVYSRAMPHLES